MPAAGQPCMVSSTCVLRPMAHLRRLWTAVYTLFRFAAIMPSHGVVHYPFHRRIADAGDRGTSAAARNQTGRAKAGGPLRRLTHTGAPGPLPAHAKPAD